MIGLRPFSDFPSLFDSGDGARQSPWKTTIKGIEVNTNNIAHAANGSGNQVENAQLQKELTAADISEARRELQQVAEHYGPKDEMVWPRVTRAIHLLERLQKEYPAAKS